MTNFDILLNALKSENYKINLSVGIFDLKPSPIGQGGNGIVYEAVINGKTVALKFLVTEASGKTKEKKTTRFTAEYFNVVSIEKRINIVKYLDYDIYCCSYNNENISFPVIIMNKYKCSLSKIQQSKTEREFINLFKFLSDTLKEIHNVGIIHRDIKPENILINENNEFYLADFGIASYNPDLFAIIAETEKQERLGNRLYSAPEQEKSNTGADKTMDIYAMGQVLQWYATGITHRGTGRQRITTVFSEFELYDRIIEKCLEQNPKNRFQSVEEIEKYIKNSRTKNIFEYLYEFHRICAKSFPKNNFRILHTQDKIKIDRFLTNLHNQEKEFDKNLWWVDGSGSFDFHLTHKGLGIWKFDITEYNITDLWMHYESSVFNDFVMFKFQKGEPFIVEGKETFYTAIVDEANHISYSEYQNGYAEINDEIIDLSNHKVEFIERQEEEGYFFIGSSGHCVIQWENEEAIRDFIENCKSKKPDIEELKIFERVIRKHKNREVQNQL